MNHWCLFICNHDLKAKEVANSLASEIDVDHIKGAENWTGCLEATELHQNSAQSAEKS